MIGSAVNTSFSGGSQFQCFTFPSVPQLMALCCRGSNFTSKWVSRYGLIRLGADSISQETVIHNCGSEVHQHDPLLRLRRAAALPGTDIHRSPTLVRMHHHPVPIHIHEGHILYPPMRAEAVQDCCSAYPLTPLIVIVIFPRRPNTLFRSQLTTTSALPAFRTNPRGVPK